MMEILKKYKYILIGTAAFVILAYVYVNFFSESDIEPLARSSAQSGAPATVDRELVALLLSLQSIELDDSILGSPAFQSLTDFSRPLVLEPVGRTNPFAPLDRGASRNPR